jgi:hypothetical protein
MALKVSSVTSRSAAALMAASSAGHFHDGRCNHSLCGGMSGDMQSAIEYRATPEQATRPLPPAFTHREVTKKPCDHFNSHTPEGRSSL